MNLNEDTERKYHPISCHYYDELEALATQRSICHIHYLNSQHQPKCIKSKIIDFITSAKEEFIILEDDINVRMDHILSVNDLFPADDRYRC